MLKPHLALEDIEHGLDDEALREHAKLWGLFRVR
jgi:hypothetical protein